MICPKCQSDQTRKNGHRSGKQNYQCKDCGRQFIESYSPKGYPPEVRRDCLQRYLEGQGFWSIERCTGVNHNTIINWVRQSAKSLPDLPTDEAEVPEIGELDELQTFVGSKKKKMDLDGG